MKLKLLVAIFLVFSAVLPSFGQSEGKSSSEAEDQSRNYAEGIFNSLPEKLELLDKSIVKIQLYVSFAQYWLDKDIKKAKKFTVKGLEELESYKSVEDELIFAHVRSPLLLLARRCAPELLPRIEKLSRPSEIFASLLDDIGSPRFIPEAARLISSEMITESPTPYLLLSSSFLFQMRQIDPKKMAEVLVAVLPFLELQASNTILKPMFSISFFYEHEQVPQNVRDRFFLVLFQQTELRMKEMNSGLLPAAHSFLTRNRVSLEPLVSAPRLNTLLTEISQKASPEVRKIFTTSEPEERSAESLLKEVENKAGEDEKDDLLLEAVYQLVKRKSFREAVNTALQMKKKEGLDGMLDDIVEASLKEKDPESALYATTKVENRVSQALYLRNISRQFRDLKLEIRARETLDDLDRLIPQIEHPVGKVYCYSLLIKELLKVDQVRAFEEAEELVKEINRTLLVYETEEGRKKAFESYPKTASQIFDIVLPLFEQVAKEESLRTFLIANSLKVNEMKLCALFGACLGKLTEKPKAAEK